MLKMVRLCRQFRETSSQDFYYTLSYRINDAYNR
jgi:hypothetical protein